MSPTQHYANSAADPRLLAARILDARKARGLTQQDAADLLGVSRPTYVAIEKGARPLSDEEIVRIAEICGQGVHQLLARQEPLRDFVAHFKAAAARSSILDPSLDAATRSLQDLCEDYLYLEGLMDAPMIRQYPSVYQVGNRDPVEASEEVADSERRRLGLGSRPLRDLEELLASEVGIRVFQIDLPSAVSGLFAYGEPLGAAIAIQRKHPPGRRLWSLAHEYAHFLTNRYEPEVTILVAGSRKPAKERFADAFARSFLLPRLELRRRFHDLKTAAASVTAGDLVALADSYGVSMQAMVLRLEEIRLIPGGTWSSFEERGFRVKDAGSMLGLQPAGDNASLPQRYVNLAVQAYDQEKITEGELMRFLRTDRQRARETLQKMTRRMEVSGAGESGELVLDLAWSLADLGRPA